MDLEEYIYENKMILNQREEFVQNLKNILYLKKKNNKLKNIVFLCVGSDRVLGDCVGPLVGSKLKEKFKYYNIYNIDIYGSLNKNVNYMNVEEIINQIEKYSKETCVIVIDAALSKSENIGKIFVKEEKTILGKSMNKNKIKVGDISIKAVVAKDMKIPKCNFKNLQSTSLKLVMELSETVALGIFDVIQFI